VFRSSSCRAALLPSLFLIISACSSAGGPLADRTSFEPATSHVAPGIVAKPASSGYLRGDASGLHLWGSRVSNVTIEALDESGRPLTGAGAPTIAVTTSDHARFTVNPVRNTYGTFALQATLAPGAPPCSACRVVRPGMAQLDVSVTGKTGGVKHFSVPVDVSHKIVAISLNPLPNPSLGGADAVLQYYDDNVKPSVIWDDVYLHNSNAFPNVAGLAFGSDDTLYIANSGMYGYPGTVTQYAAGSGDPTPINTFSNGNLRSPAGVALDKTGNLYVADNGNETITRFPTSGSPVTIRPGWKAGSDVVGVAADSARGYLYVAMTGVGMYNPPNRKNVGKLISLPLDFDSNAKPVVSIESTHNNGVNQPYGLALDPSGSLLVVNDYVSIVEGPPGPGPIHSTLTRYNNALSSSDVLPDATSSAGLKWTLGVASDSAGAVYVSNDAPPNKKGNSGRISLFEYDGGFASKSKPAKRIDLGKGMPSVYAEYYFNIQGVAVDPSPLNN
jgi:NHL repeat